MPLQRQSYLVDKKSMTNGQTGEQPKSSMSFKTSSGGRGGYRRISEEFDLIILPYLLYVFGHTGLGKQCWPRSDATKCSVWSGSTLFTTHPAILHTWTGSEIDFLKRKYKEECLKFIKFIQNFQWKWNFESKVLRLNPSNPLWIHPWVA